MARGERSAQRSRDDDDRTTRMRVATRHDLALTSRVEGVQSRELRLVEAERSHPRPGGWRRDVRVGVALPRLRRESSVRGEEPVDVFRRSPRRLFESDDALSDPPGQARCLATLSREAPLDGVGVAGKMPVEHPVSAIVRGGGIGPSERVRGVPRGEHLWLTESRALELAEQLSQRRAVARVEPVRSTL